MRRTITITTLIGLCALLGSCRSPNRASLGQAFDARMAGFSSSLSALIGREDRMSNLTSTTGKMLRTETEPKRKTDHYEYVFWDRNFSQLSEVNVGKLADTVIVGPRVAKAPGSKGLLSSGTLTDPLLRGEHFVESFKKLLVMEQRWPDLAGWQSPWRD